LQELQSANPAAFAIVNALLAKHAKGQIKLAPEERGPDVFRRMMTPPHLARPRHTVALPYEADAVQPAVVDQKQYNPQAAADKDENMVDRLLGAVAGLAGKKGSKIALLRQRRHQKKQEADNALLRDSELFESPTPAAAVPVEQVEEQEQAAVQEPVSAEKPKPHENSYLKGIDLSGDMPEVEGAGHHAHKSEGADLASFSFDDAPAAPVTQAPKRVETPKPKKDNAFLKWLGFVKKAPAPEASVEAPAAQPTARKNPYLMDFLS
jgi:hypothetical protein